MEVPECQKLQGGTSVSKINMEVPECQKLQEST